MRDRYYVEHGHILSEFGQISTTTKNLVYIHSPLYHIAFVAVPMRTGHTEDVIICGSWPAVINEHHHPSSCSWSKPKIPG